MWEKGKGQWMDQSPIRYAGEWKTPTLMTQGEMDYRVPVNESMTTFKMLQRQKVPCAPPRDSPIGDQRHHLDLIGRIRAEQGAKPNVGGVQVPSFAQPLHFHAGRRFDSR